MMEKRSERLVYDLNLLNKSLKERMSQLENMATIGQFSAEIIHEVNNLLTVIYGYAQILMKEVELKNAPSDNKKYLAIIENEIKRCKNITKNVIALAKPGKEEKDINISDMAAKIVEFFQNSKMAKNITFTTSLDPDVPVIKANPGQMHQAILNVVLNSIQSIEGNGDIAIKSGTEENRLFLSIKDTGRGIRKENINKIMEPSYTEGKQGGAGLGLSITARVVKQHGGKIKINSTYDKGTEFTIYLPLPGK